MINALYRHLVSHRVWQGPVASAGREKWILRRSWLPPAHIWHECVRADTCLAFPRSQITHQHLKHTIGVEMEGVFENLAIPLHSCILIAVHRRTNLNFQRSVITKIKCHCQCRTSQNRVVYVINVLIINTYHSGIL